MKQGLVLDKVVLLGRTLEEYAHYFALDLPALRGKSVLDVASGVSSFTAESNARGIQTTAFDLIYELPADAIQARCEPDLDLVVNRVGSTRDIAAAIAFLISEDAGYISGQTLNVDGGLYMH